MPSNFRVVLIAVVFPFVISAFALECDTIQAAPNDLEWPMSKTIWASVLLLSAGGCMPGQDVIGRVGSGSSSTRIDTAPSQAMGTVAVAVALSEGLVLAADSRMTWSTPQTYPGYKILSDHTSKVFDVGRYGVATYGEAFLGDRSIASWVSDFREKQKGPNASDVDSFAKEFSLFFSALYDKQFQEPKLRPALGFLVAGYDTAGKGKILKFEFPSMIKPTVMHDTQGGQGAAWSGHTDVIQRLIKGYDGRIGGTPFYASLPADQQKKFVDELSSLEYRIPFNALMLQDGVDFALSLVRATVEMQRFAFGTVGNFGDIPTVGGAVDVLVVTPSGPTWVKRKYLTAN